MCIRDRCGGGAKGDKLKVGMVTDMGGVDDGLDIEVPGKKPSWTTTLVKNAAAPLSSKTPDWLAKTIPGTLINLVGNLIGNTQVPKRQNQSFLDKLFNR